MPAAVSFARDVKYADLFQNFVEGTSYSDSIRKLMDTQVLPNVQNLLKSDSIRILSVGPGNGIPDSEILFSLNQEMLACDKVMQISLTTVEPDPDFNAVLQPTLTTLCQRLKNIEVNINFNECTLEEYMQQHEGSIDLMLMPHCLYYMEALKVLPWSYDILSTGGCLILIIGAKDNFLNRISEFINSCKNDTLPTYIEKEHLAHFLSSSGCRYLMSSATFDLNVKNIFIEGCTSGTMLLDFLTHTANAKEVLGLEVWRSVLEFIRASVHKETETAMMVDLVDDQIVILK